MDITAFAQSTLIPVIVGAVMTGITQFCKTKNWNHYLVMGILAIIVAVGYQLFVAFINPELQAYLIQFTLGAFGTATIIYNAFLKKAQ